MVNDSFLQAILILILFIPFYFICRVVFNNAFYSINTGSLKALTVFSSRIVRKLGCQNVAPHLGQQKCSEQDIMACAQSFFLSLEFHSHSFLLF